MDGLRGLDVVIGQAQHMGPGGKNLFWGGTSQGGGAPHSGGPDFWNWENFWENWWPLGREVDIEEIDDRPAIGPSRIVRGDAGGGSSPEDETYADFEDAALLSAAQELMGAVTKEDVSPYLEAATSAFTGKGAKDAAAAKAAQDKLERERETAAKETKTVLGVSLGVFGALAAGLLIYLAARKK